MSPKTLYILSARLWAVISFFVMIAVNVLANLLPLNGITTGQVSEKFPTLFTPAPATFAIWGLIYMLLAAYTFRQSGVFQRLKDSEDDVDSDKIRLAFSLSSLLNVCWLFAWHSLQIGWSLILLLLLFFCLAYIYLLTRKEKPACEKLVFLRIPFSVYFGWITVAAIANLAVYAASASWDLYVSAETVWTMFLLISGLIVGGCIICRFRDAVYGAVMLWAYGGILIRHLSASGLAGQHPLIVITIVLCLTVFTLVILWPLLGKKAGKR